MTLEDEIGDEPLTFNSSCGCGVMWMGMRMVMWMGVWCDVDDGEYGDVDDGVDGSEVGR